MDQDTDPADRGGTGGPAAAGADALVDADVRATAEPMWTTPPFENASVEAVLEEMGNELDVVNYLGGYFSEMLYHDHAQVPRTVDDHVDELKDVRDPALEVADGITCVACSRAPAPPARSSSPTSSAW